MVLSYECSSRGGYRYIRVFSTPNIRCFEMISFIWGAARIAFNRTFVVSKISSLIATLYTLFFFE